MLVHSIRHLEDISFVTIICIREIAKLDSMHQGTKRMPRSAVTKSVVAIEPGGKKREEIYVDIIEKISITFSSSVRENS